MNNISVRERFELGNNKPMNDRLKSRLSTINKILFVLDADGVNADILIVAKTTDFLGNIEWKITCKDKKFKRLLNDSLKQFITNI